jgi:hypothetical protein
MVASTRGAPIVSSRWRCTSIRRVEVDWCESRAPYRGMYRGHDGWLRLFAEMRAPFEDVSSEPHRFVVAGQHVAVPYTVRVRGRDGIEVNARNTLVSPSSA